MKVSQRKKYPEVGKKAPCFLFTAGGGTYSADGGTWVEREKWIGEGEGKRKVISDRKYPVESRDSDGEGESSEW